MNDDTTTLSNLKAVIKAYCDERDWDKYHNPKDLAVGIITEASEILEHFRFKSEAEMEAMFKDAKKSTEISEEMADTLYFTLRLAQKYNVDLSSAFEKKMEKNRNKYPIEKAKGCCVQQFR